MKLRILKNKLRIYINSYMYMFKLLSERIIYNYKILIPIREIYSFFNVVIWIINFYYVLNIMMETINIKSHDDNEYGWKFQFLNHRWTTCKWIKLQMGKLYFSLNKCWQWIWMEVWKKIYIIIDPMMKAIIVKHQIFHKYFWKSKEKNWQLI